MRTDWTGDYLDGRTATRQPATIRLMREGLEVTTAAGGTRVWRYRDLRQTEGFYAGEEVRLEWGEGLPETLLIADPAFLTSLHEVAPHVGLRFHDPRRRSVRRWWTIGAAGGVLSAAAGIYLWGIPLMASVVTPYVPTAWEDSVGQSAVSVLAPSGERCGDPALRAALDAIAVRLLTAHPASPYTMRFYVVNSPVRNALAAPGGHVVIFRGLLERMRTPEELAGVMAHELQHVLLRHATQQVIQGVGIGLLLMAFSGDVTGPVVYGLQTARTLGELRYSRRAEDEADREGMRMLLDARVDPAGLVAFFEALRKEEGSRLGALEYLSSHPMTAERLDRLRSLAASARASSEPLLAGEDWPALVRRC
jgi:Zn-dependent protease with chaperone function